MASLGTNGSARQIVAMLMHECAAAVVDCRAGVTIGEISRDDHFRIETSRGEIEADVVALATGGLSIPKMGATGFSHRVARRFGLGMTETHPALVPLTFDGNDHDLMAGLRGVALPCVAQTGGARFEEAMLFTHKSLSDPAILQISSYWNQGDAITLDLLQGRDAVTVLIDSKTSQPRTQPVTVLATLLPSRLAQALAVRHLRNDPMAGQRNADLQRLGDLINGWSLTAHSTEGYAKAEVRRGGVDTAALSSKTMEARAVPALFVIGEAVEVTGRLGRYNFQWVWSSGWAAGMAV